jgi:glycosyltransferase involved in cell wall biosynthesis
MKICVVSETFAPQDEGGAEISSRHAARNLSTNHDVVVLALGLDGIKGAEPGEVPSTSGYRIHRVPFRNSYLPGAKRPAVGALSKALWHARNAVGAVDAADLRAFFQAEKFDLIYAQNNSRMQPALYCVAANLGIPVCQHLRDYALLCPRTSMYRGGQNCATPCGTCRMLTLRARQATSTVNTVIAVSNFVRRRYLEHGLFTDADWHVLHNTNTVRADFDAALLAGRPDPTHGFTIGYLGALSQEKGVEVLLRAFCALPAALEARLLVAGRGHQGFVDQMQQIVRDAGVADRVEWLGHVKPETVFARSEVIVVPSLWHEPQGRVLVESAVYGLPVIAARTGGTAEIVEGQGTGWTYDATDTNALRSLLQTAAESGAANWRASSADRFPGLVGFLGTAEDTGFYSKLEGILVSAMSIARGKQD